MPPLLSGIVLCGGLSRRMGQDKASLPWAGQTLLGHVVAILRPLVSEVLVVARAGQALPVHSARVVTDRIPRAGPLGGLEAGLEAMATPYGIVVACDMPWLEARLLQAMADLSPGWDLVIPRLAAVKRPFHRHLRWHVPPEAGRPQGGGMIPRLLGRYQPLHAVYAKRLQPVAADLLETGERRLHALVGRVKARVLDEAFLRATDPSLRSTRSLDDRESYEEATALALRS